jgi:hypothetical protein
MIKLDLRLLELSELNIFDSQTELKLYRDITENFILQCPVYIGYFIHSLHYTMIDSLFIHEWSESITLSGSERKPA